MKKLFRYNQYFITWLFVFTIFPIYAQTITPLYPTENQVSLNGTWKFKYIPSVSVGEDSMFFADGFDISKWADIQVPGHWELQGFAEPNYKSVNEGTGLYRTNFNIPDSFHDNQIFIRFEGALYAYIVYINGKEIGQWSSSFNAASFNISNFVHFGKANTLSVKVSTRVKGYQFDISDCWALSGIFREVVVFSTPNIYMDDYTIQTFLSNKQSAKVKASVKLQDLHNEGIENCSVKAILYSPEGKIIGEKSLPANSKENILELSIDQAQLWTAETPILYKLNLLLIKHGKPIQQINQKVGIREISVDDSVLKLNGEAIKLRGVDHHDIVPETGRAMTRRQIMKDLMLMKKANVNFIRTSHYPPDRRMLDLCDSLGFYVVCEVPFNFGSGLLTDTTYQDILLKRANATLLRDKNHPSIIIWSIGNENPLTPITEVTGKFVKHTDPTRPICYPQMGRYFDAEYKNFPDFFDILTPHYENATWIRNFALETTRPVILTEYAHAMGLSFGNVGDVWKEMFRNKKFAGGAVWHFQDQGILRKAIQPVDIEKPTNFVWIDSLNYYDMGNIEGLDGIVYADRTPQVDYWELRKVYSPVQIIESEVPVHSGSQELKLNVYNQYDFTNLNTLTGKWQLFQNSKLFKEGNITVNCSPHDTATFTLPIVLPDKPESNVWLLQFDFKDKAGMPVYEHTISMLTAERFDKVKEMVYHELKKENLKFDTTEDKARIESGNFKYEIEKENISIKLDEKRKNIPLIESGIYARVGRIPKVADLTIRDRHFADSNDYFWDPFILKPCKVENGMEKTDEKEYRFSAKGEFLKGEKFPGQKIEGEIQYVIQNSGEFTVSYNLKPVNASGVFLEAGVSFILSSKINNFMWLGDGPYPSYPDKHQLNNFGIHGIHKADINFNGNRGNVEIAVLTDNKGNGIAIFADKANISVELINHQIVVSHNALLTGLGNKKTLPLYISTAQDASGIKGQFNIVPLTAGHWPQKLKEVFEENNKEVKQFNPFYYSYDTTK